ncbi:response regulator transcription factor [Cohnella cellulosilytica]|uniref:Response regulator transcription factor n=1 Tax=Cohnella cellulosilytica TaxID=986710 RepID=A0ABW2FL73_9BACL
MSAAQILIVDEEKHTRSTLGRYLKKEGFRVLEESHGLSALRRLLNRSFDLIVLDIELPGINGLELCHIIKSGSDTPVMFVTGRESEQDVIGGFQAGADDFVVKPFSPREVVCRISGILHRTSATAKRTHKATAVSPIALPRLGMDPSTRRVTADGARLELTVREFELLYYLAANFGKPLSRQQLIKSVWQYAFRNDSRTVDTHIKRLREKLNAASPGSGEIIQTVRGFGYGLIDS